MNKKLITLLAMVLVLLSIFAVSASAAETTATVYLTTGGAGTKDGSSPENAASRFGSVLPKIGSDVTSVTAYIVTELDMVESSTGVEPKLKEFPFDITIKGYDKNSAIKLSSNFHFTQSTNDNTITFDLPIKVDSGKTFAIVGGYNNFVFGKNCTTIGGGLLNFFGGVVGYRFINTDSYNAADVVGNEGICEREYSIVVENGVFNSFNGGNWRPNIDYVYGSIAAPISITINGGTFGSPTTNYKVATNNKTFTAVSISGMSILADKATLNITGGTFYCPIYAQGRSGTIMSGASQASYKVASSNNYYAMDGDIKINITGGEFKGGEISAYYTHAAYTTLARGNFDVSITGGTFKAGTVIDATQVKAYPGKTEKATLTYSGVTNIEPKRFDVVNGVNKKYDEPTRVVFIGDSITEGYAPSGASVSRITHGYPAKFLAKCEEANKEVIVSNFGIGSAGFIDQPTKTYRYYMDMLAYPMVLNETDPTYVFFAMGTNDANVIGGTGGAYELFEKNFEKIITDMGEQPSVEKVFITNAIFRYANMAASHRAASALHQAQKGVADKLHAKNEKYIYVDLYGLTLPMAKNYTLFAYGTDTDGDNLHPTKAGLAAMGEHCYNAVYNNTYAPANDYRLTEIYLSDDGTQFGDGTKASPINNIVYANGISAYDKEVTWYIDGTLTLPANTNIYLTGAPSKLNIVGVGSDAQLIIKGNTLKCGGNTRFDNITLVNNYTDATYLVGCYNSIEITDTVKTTSLTGKNWHFCAGFVSFPIADEGTSTQFDTVTSVSSDKDCTVSVYGGTFTRFVFGNIRNKGLSPVGTYSGDMTVNVGGNVSISDTESYVGIVGHNYNKGNITAYINKWANREVAEYASVGTVTSPITYNKANNTGTVEIILPKGIVEGDFDGSGTVELADVVLSVEYFFKGVPADKQSYFGGKSSLTLVDILTIIAMITK